MINLSSVGLSILTGKELMRLIYSKVLPTDAIVILEERVFSSMVHMQCLLDDYIKEDDPIAKAANLQRILDYQPIFAKIMGEMEDTV